MIELDVDLTYLAKYYDIGTRRISQYGEKSIEEIMKEEAASGNAKAANFDLEVLKNPKELAKLFKLSTARNRYKILKNMNSSDLKYLMQYLSKDDLLMGLNFFTKDKLLALIENMPKNKIAKVLFNKFSPEKFLKMVPEKEIDKFFDSTKIDKEQVIASVSTLPPEALDAIMENITGKNSNNVDPNKVVDTLRSTNPNKFRKAIQSLNKEFKTKIVTDLTRNDPKLFLEFSKDALMTPLEQLDKPELIKTMSVLESEDLLKMLDELPEDLLSVVVTQIDPEVFAELLCDKFQDVLADIAVA